MTRVRDSGGRPPLDGRVALVTGGTTGIGAAISARLADLGAQVMAGRHKEGDGSAALRAGGRDVEVFTGDLAHPLTCARIVDACIEHFGRIDILVNNAAITGPPAIVPFLESTDEHLDQVIDVNLKAPYRCARAAARAMTAGGVIVNIGSVAAFAAQRDASAYVASKAGLLGLTRGLAFELAPRGVRVVLVAPGDIATESDIATGADSSSGSGSWWERRTPLGRRGEPDDVAAAVAFVCTDQASFITGTAISVDGGWLSY